MGTAGVAAHHLETLRTEVQGRPAGYSVGGDGFPVLFLHGWGLADRAYKRALKRLIAQGCRVYAPALPGFGETAELPVKDRTMSGYAAWAEAFLDSVGVEQPVLLLGHSFGGGVAIRLAYDAPRVVRYLVLLDSIGGGWGSSTTAFMSAVNRAGWMWALRAIRDPAPIVEGVQVLRAAAEDFIPNLLRHPRAMVEVGMLARRTDLQAELEELGRRDVPILVLWGDHDRVLPTGSFESLCRAIGTAGHVVSGNHSWLLADPDAFGEVMSNVVDLAGARPSMELEQLLESTSIPPDVVASLVRGAAPLWLMSEPAEVLAGDLVLCYPRLGDGEVRAVARPLEDDETFRLTVVAADRPGLLASTTAVLADEGLSVLTASATTWTTEGIALHAITVEAPVDFVQEQWDMLGRRLRSVGDGHMPQFAFAPRGRAEVRATPQSMGRSLLRVSAEDQLGLLWAICDWLANAGVSIESARVTGAAGRVDDEFVVAGAFDPQALARHLTGEDLRGRWCSRLRARVVLR